MKHKEERDVQSPYDATGVTNTPPELLKPLLQPDSVSGQPLTSRYVETILSGFSTTRLFIVTFVHVVGIPSETGGFKPIVDEEWIENLYRVANDIWSQACIQLTPYRTRRLVTEFRDLAILGFAGLCLGSEDTELVKLHDVTHPELITINVYLVEDTSGSACGSPVTGHIILPTAGFTPEFMGRVFAHELGHILLNPLGVDDSANPEHLMFHPEVHPETPPGSRKSLFLSDCVGAQARAREDLVAFDSPGAPLIWSQPPIACQMNPRLGNNISVILVSDH